MSEITKINWHWYKCQECGNYGDAHMVSEQASLELCDDCHKKRKAVK